jgi:cell division protease FtsH
MKSTQKTLALWAVLIVAGLVFYQMFQHRRQSTIEDFNYQKFVEALENKKVKSVTFRTESKEITGEIKDEFVGEFKGGKFFNINGNTDSEGFKLVREIGEKNGTHLLPNYENADTNSVQQFLLNYLPLLLIVGMFIFLMRRAQNF